MLSILKLRKIKMISLSYLTQLDNQWAEKMLPNGRERSEAVSDVWCSTA